MKKLISIYTLGLVFLGIATAFAQTTGVPSVVPEPSTIILFGLGLLGVAGMSRKKK